MWFSLKLGKSLFIKRTRASIGAQALILKKMAKGELEIDAG